MERIRKRRVDMVLEGEESSCRHDIAVLCIGRVDYPEAEGGVLTVKCGQCGENLQEGVMVE